jgi:hypothetical protein
VKEPITGGTPTKKLSVLDPCPAGFVAEIRPGVAPLGTVARSCVSPSTLKEAAGRPPNATPETPVNPLPVSVISVPTGPPVGVNDVIEGAAPTK